MLKWIKQKIANWINHNVINIRYDNKNNPFHIRFGENSAIVAPLQLNGGKYISFGKDTQIEKGAWLSAFDTYQKQTFNPRISIGNNVHIGHHACITAINEIQIGDGCLISEYAYISDHSHGLNPTLKEIPAEQELESKGGVNIGNRTFLGYRVTILAGVSLGENCIVGAHSVVTNSFPDHCMIAGTPARLIKTYCNKEQKWLSIS